MDFEIKERYGLTDLVEIMRLLRRPGGCPWDREQTHRSIRQNLLEEAYEVADAIDAQNADMLCEELGDLLLQVVFHSQMAEEDGEFSLGDVADGICKKLVLRHPHIFADARADTADAVLERWEQIKREEKGQETAAQTLLAVPAAFPALMRSQKVQKRAAKTGFDYPDADMALSDLEREIAELRQAMQEDDGPHCAEEMGDVLFSAVNVARLLGLDAESCLIGSCKKFIERFERVEGLAIQRHIDMKHASLDRLNELWSEAKRAEAAK